MTKSYRLSFATWNIRTLVESAGGDRRICRSRPQSQSQSHSEAPPTAPPTGPHNVDRKLDFLVKELKRLGVSITGIQETKWFGKDIWTADGYTLLHSGRPLPNEDDPHSRNEGVGIILDKQATDAWKDAGETWEAISSKIVTARLHCQVTYRGRRQCGGSRWSKDKFITVVSVYAPTARAPKTVTDKFADDLQSVLDNVPADDILLVLGDMNARVGRRESDDDTWKEVRGPHGIGHCNEAGETYVQQMILLS